MFMSSVLRVLGAVGCDLRLVAVAHGKQHFLGIDQVAAPFAVVFEYPRLDDRVDRTGLFAETAEYAFGEVDVIPGRAPCAILACLRLDRDGERRADGLAQLARDATLLPV